MSVAIVIIAITGIVSFICFNDWKLRNQLVFSAAAVKERGEYYRFISSAFVHSGWIHLLLNMYILYVFGSFAEYTFTFMFGKAFAAAAVLIFYLLCIIAANLYNYYRHQDNYAFVSAGASDGVAALMWPFILYLPWQWFLFPPLPAIIVGPAYIIYSAYKLRSSSTDDNKDHAAHLWGAVFGLILYVFLMFALAPELVDHFMIEVVQPKAPNFL